MAKKEKTASKKADAIAKRKDSATADAVKDKKAGKERFKGKGKWDGAGTNGDDLGTELAALGLRIKEITGDGNCFFRALGDQLQGDERQHVQLRQRVVSYMLDHQDDFAPFVEDDERFDSYVARMKKDGVWAGYMEVVAASRCLAANLTIYQAGQPRWRVINHPEGTAPMLHLSYHDGQHYNSVRCADDYGVGPPAPVVMRGDGMVAATRRPPPAAAAAAAGNGIWDERDERRVASSTACTDMALVRKALEEAHGDVEAAIERVIEALAAEPAATADAAAAAVTPTEPSACTATNAPDEADSSQPTAGVGPERNDGAAGADGAGDLRQGSGAAAAGPWPSCEAKKHEGGRDGEGGCSDEPAAGVMAGGEPRAAVTDGAFCIVDADATSSSTLPSSPPPPLEAATAAVAAAGKGVRMTSVRIVGGKTKAAAALKIIAAAGSATAASRPSNNKPCPCGSGKKYKACCGPAAAAAARRRAAADTTSEAALTEHQSDARVPVAQVAALLI